MAKVYGLKQCYVPVRETYSQTIISYSMTPESDGVHATWYEVYFNKKEVQKPSLAQIKEAVIADINARVKDNIISGFVWNGNPVWLSQENQMNFSQAVVPATLKIGEQQDGTPIYKTFSDADELKAFNDACSLWRQQCLTDGYQKKDGMDWAPYEAYFPITPNAE
jgi:hypothetical protein